MANVPCIKEGGGKQVTVGSFDVNVNYTGTTFDLTGIANYKNIIAILPGPLTGATAVGTVTRENLGSGAGGVVNSYTAGASTVNVGRMAYALADGSMSIIARFYYVMVK